MASHDDVRSTVVQSGNLSQLLGVNKGVGAAISVAGVVAVATGGAFTATGDFTGAVLHAASTRLIKTIPNHKPLCLIISIVLP